MRSFKDFQNKYPKITLIEVKEILGDSTPRRFNEFTIFDEHQISILLSELERRYPKEKPPEKEQPKQEPIKESNYLRDTLMQEGGEYRKANHTIYVHSDLMLGDYDFTPQIRRKCSYVITQCMASGKITNWKVCSDEQNRGWYRTPLAGNHYYLWWTRSSEKPIPQGLFSEKAFIFRCVRHHDNHDPLTIDDASLNDFDEFTPRESHQKSFMQDPWTEAQASFINSEEPVRLLNGSPGSGKTSSLLRVIELRSNQKVLFLTWSKRLTDFAQTNLKTYTTIDTEVKCFYYGEFLSELNQKNYKPITLAENVRRFNKAIEKYAAKDLGVWAKYKQELFAEIRAHIMGKFTYLTPNDLCSREIREAYFQFRGNNETYKLAWKVYANLMEEEMKLKDEESPERIFPELWFALQTYKALKDRTISVKSFLFNRIVVDEVQDLTNLDIRIILELFKAIEQITSTPPFMQIAGDESQTIRPTGYQWAELKTLLTSYSISATEADFDENLRCPEAINQLLVRINNFYGILDKTARPGRFINRMTSFDEDAHVGRILIDSEEELVALLKELEGKEDLEIMYPMEERATWVIKNDLDNLIRSPSELKGLEFRNIIVLDIANSLNHLTEYQEADLNNKMDNNFIRVVIDQLRVTISRATERIFFVDYKEIAKESKTYQELFRHISESNIDILKSEMGESKDSIEEKAQKRIEEARSLQEDFPEKAWYSIKKGWSILNDESFNYNEKIKQLRRELAEITLVTSVHYLQQNKSNQALIESVFNDYFNASPLEQFKTFFVEFIQWFKNRNLSPIPFLQLLTQIESHQWATQIFKDFKFDIYHSLEFSAYNAHEAKLFLGNLELWLSVLNFEDLNSRAKHLREIAFDTLLKERFINEAEMLLYHFKEKDLYRTGQLYELQERYKEAGEHFELVQKYEDAVRVYRLLGDYNNVLKYPEFINQEAIEWLKTLDLLFLEKETISLKQKQEQIFDFLLEKVKDTEFYPAEQEIVNSALRKISPTSFF